MDWFYQLFGEGKDLTALQMSMRAFVMFFITLFLVRIGGMRAFGKKSAFDSIIVIVLGSVVARGIAGASAFGATVASSFVLVLIHRLLGWLIIQSKALEKIIKGDHLLVFENGKIIKDNLTKASMSTDDLFESLRQEAQLETLDGVEKAYVENSGRISFILKKKE